jgi:hypothetical protein
LVLIAKRFYRALTIGMASFFALDKIEDGKKDTMESVLKRTNN